MLRSLSIFISIVCTLLLASSCSSPKLLFTVADGKSVTEQTDQLSVERGDKTVDIKKDLKLKEGDVITIREGIDGTGIRTFHTVSTVHGPATLVVKKDYLEQKNGTAMHNASEGRLLIPGMSIDHEGAAYLVAIQETKVDIIVFDGKILVSPTDPEVDWPPFFVESRQRRQVWLDGNLAPNQPLRPNDLNRWIDDENQLLKAGNSPFRMVPSVVSLPSEDAQGLVASANFPYSLKFTEEGEGDLGTITRQDPPAGRRVSANQNVSIFERARPVKVPDVLGMSLGAAQDKLLDVGLNGAEAGRTVTRSVEPFMVNKQQPAPGELLAEGATVSLTIEAVSVQVPNLVGKSMADARKMMGELTLEIGRTDYDLSYEGPDKVISQSPIASSYVEPESVITVVRLAKGYKVPNVIGLTETEAKSTLSGAGFSVGEITRSKSDEVPESKVMSQQPAAGAVSGKDVPVSFELSTGD